MFFYHTYAGSDASRYGKVYRHRFKNISTNYKCTGKGKDIAMASLEDFDGYWTSTVTVTDSVEYDRYIDDEDNVKYNARDPKNYSDYSMLLVGKDAIYDKLMVSENCGLIDKFESGHISKLNNDQRTHDCLSTPGYSGGPIFQKRWNKKQSKYEYNLVCVHSGAVPYSKKSKNYRKIIDGKSGGYCTAIERKSYRQLENALVRL